MSVNGCVPHPVSWSELWDQTGAVASHTQKGIEYLEGIGNFAKERAQIEEEYAKKLKNLVLKTIGKKKEDEESAKTFTYIRAFTSVLREVEAVASQHEVIAEKLKTDVVLQTKNRSMQLRAARKQYLLDLQAIFSNLQGATEHLNKQQRGYGKAYKEAEAAYAKYYKAEKNMEISRLDLEKAKTNAHMRNQMSEDAKSSYAHALQGANDAQDQYYGNYLPDVLDKLKVLDMERIADTVRAVEMSIRAEIDVHGIIARCHDDMLRAVDQVNAEHDTIMVVEQNKTGYIRPAPIQFEDLGNPDGSGVHASQENMDSTLRRGVLGGMRKDSKSVVRNKSMKIFGGGGDKYKSDANGDYGQLPPHQRIKKLEEKIETLTAERHKAQKEKEGCIKLQQAYRGNPKLGNAADCDQLLAKHNKELDSLSTQINKYRTLLDDVQSQNNLPLGSIVDTPPSVRSGSSTSSAAPKPPLSNGRSSVSEESITSIDNSHHKPAAEHQREGMVYEDCTPLPVLGTALVQFGYDGGTEGTVCIREGQELLLIEKDEGDGWTRVKSLNGDAEGFVPSSYLKCSWYPAD